MARGRLANSIGALIVTTVLLTALAAPVPAAAQEIHEFNIPLSNAAREIETLGVQAGIHILASAHDLKGRQLNSVNGTISTDQALTNLLAGTGLQYRYVGERAVAVLATA